MTKLSRRKHLYQLGTRTAELLLRLRPSRRYRACEHTLRLIGQWCVDHGTDGRVTERDLREIDDTSAWRVMAVYVSMLVRVGALIPLGHDTYSVAFFLRDNLPAKERARRDALAREKTRLRVQNHRAKKKSEKTNAYPPSNAKLTDLRSVVDHRTNKTEPPAVPNSSANDVPSPVSSRKSSIVAESTEPVDFEAAARRMMDKAAPPAPPPPARAARRPCRRAPARMPKIQVPITEHHVTEALQEIGADPNQAPPLFAELWRMRATDVEVGYAARSLREHISLGRRIAHPLRYLVGIIKTQRQHRGVAA